MTENRPGNWLAVSRDMLDHPVVGAGRPLKAADPRIPGWERYAAWSDILRTVQYRPGKVNNKGEVQQLQVGEMMAARAYLAKRWRATEKAVRIFLDDLERHGMISRQIPVAAKHGQQSGHQRANKCCILTVCNYATYQAVERGTARVSRLASGPAKGQQRASERPESNTANTETQEDSLCGGTAPGAVEPTQREVAAQRFEDFWSAFPAERRRNKGEARDLFCTIVLGQHKKRRATAEMIIAAVRAGSGIDPKYPPMPTTWLNGGRWEDARPDSRVEALPVERQQRLADEVLAAKQDWPAAYKANPHQPECLFTEPAIRQKLAAAFDRNGRFVGRRPTNGSHFTSHEVRHAPEVRT